MARDGHTVIAVRRGRRAAHHRSSPTPTAAAPASRCVTRSSDMTVGRAVTPRIQSCGNVPRAPHSLALISAPTAWEALRRASELPALAAHPHRRAPWLEHCLRIFSWPCHPLSAPLRPALRRHRTGHAQRTFRAESTRGLRGLSQAHGNSAARNAGLRLTRACRAPAKARSATLLRPASSAVRLAHPEDFRQ